MLHFVYRSSGKENRKPRPPFYGKMLSLLSFIRAVELVPDDSTGEVIFLNDAPVDAAIHALMTFFGDVIDVPGLTLDASYGAAIRLHRSRRWDDDHLVYFAEDDYLYQPDCFVSLLAAAAQAMRPSYLSLCASARGREPSGRPVPPERRAVERPGVTILAAGHRWGPALSSTSSFAVHVGALRQDLWLHRLAPRCGGAWDHVISLAHKGQCPFRWTDVWRPFLDPGRSWAGATAHAALRATLNLGAIAARRHWHPLLAPSPCLATHLELPHLAAGVDWAAVAEGTQRWALQRGIAARCPARPRRPD